MLSADKLFVHGTNGTISFRGNFADADDYLLTIGLNGYPFPISTVVNRDRFVALSCESNPGCPVPA
jgi:hypothetical protein